MRKLLPLFFLFIFAGTLIGQDYQNFKWLHQTPHGNTLRWVKMWDANNWYAVGYSGTFMKTSNAGASWFFHQKAGIPRTDGSTGYLYDAHFFNQSTGVVVGTGGVMRTTNGGQTFDTVQVNVPVGTSTVYQVYFLNDQIGYLAGPSTARIARTSDGGLTWTINTTLTSATYYDVWTPNDTLIIAATSSGNIRRSTDAGLTWATISTGASATMYKLEFENATTGWVSGTSSSVRYTTDAGLTWTNANTGIPTGKTFYDIDIVPGTPNAVYLTGDSYDLYKTTDMGTTWTTVSFLSPTQPWTSTHYATDFFGNSFAIVGAFGLFESKTGTANPVCYTNFIKAGNTYDIWSYGDRIVAIGAPSAGGVQDNIMISTNGGNTWSFPTLTDAPRSPVYVPAPEEGEQSEMDLTAASSTTFRSLLMTSPTNGTAVGSLGAVYKTTTGGLTWDSVVTNISATADLWKIDFVSPSIGWAFSNTSDAAGTIWKTTDAGATWTQQVLTGQTTSATRIYGADMVNENYGWVVNYTPRPFKTTDGGATWVLQLLSDAYGGFLYDIQMFDTLNGYCIGGSGRFYKTTNGGTNWDVQPTPVTASLYDMEFADMNTGVISGSSGVILYTTDGGTTWQVDGTSGVSTNYAIYVKYPSTDVDTTSLYVGGGSGYIFKSSIYLVPVELASFRASVNGSAVTLNWSTATELNNLGFEVQRSSDGNWVNLGFVSGKGTTTEISQYSFIDKNLKEGIYSYRIKQIDQDGSYNYYNLPESVEISVPLEFELSQNYPNPFNPSTSIRFSVANSGLVQLKVYDILGKEVTTLVNEQREAGRYEVQFDGSKYSSGVYFYEIKAGDFTAVKKLMLMK